MAEVQGAGGRRVWSVAEVAERKGVSEAAVRARLRDGALPGQNVTRGRRPVWEVFDSPELHTYLGSGSGDSQQPPLLAPTVREPEPEPLQPTPAAAVSDRAATVSDPAASRVGELEAEVAHLRAQLAAVLSAHDALVHGWLRETTNVGRQQ